MLTVYALGLYQNEYLIGGAFVVSTDCRGGPAFALTLSQTKSTGTFGVNALPPRQATSITVYNAQGVPITGTITWNGTLSPFSLSTTIPTQNTLFYGTMSCGTFFQNSWLPGPVPLSQFAGILQILQGWSSARQQDGMIYADAARTRKVTLPKSYPQNTPLTIQRVDHGRGKIRVTDGKRTLSKLKSCGCHGSVTLQRVGNTWQI